MEYCVKHPSRHPQISNSRHCLSSTTWSRWSTNGVMLELVIACNMKINIILMINDVFYQNVMKNFYFCQKHINHDSSEKVFLIYWFSIFRCRSKKDRNRWKLSKIKVFHDFSNILVNFEIRNLVFEPNHLPCNVIILNYSLIFVNNLTVLNRFWTESWL